MPGLATLFQASPFSCLGIHKNAHQAFRHPERPLHHPVLLSAPLSSHLLLFSHGCASYYSHTAAPLMNSAHVPTGGCFDELKFFCSDWFDELRQ